MIDADTEPTVKKKSTLLCCFMTQFGATPNANHDDELDMAKAELPCTRPP